MGLSRSWITNHDHILLLTYKVTAGQMPDLSLRHMFQVGEVKLLHGLCIRKPCGMDFPLPVAFLTVLQLLTHQRHQKIVKTFIALQLSDHFFIMVKSRYSQLFGIHGNQLAVQLVHLAATPHFSS